MSKIGKFGKRLKFWKKDKNKPKKTKLKNRNETKTSTVEFEEQNIPSASKQKSKTSKRKERDDPKTIELEDKMTQLVLENKQLKHQLQNAASQTENGLPRMSEAQILNGNKSICINAHGTVELSQELTEVPIMAPINGRSCATASDFHNAIEKKYAVKLPMASNTNFIQSKKIKIVTDDQTIPTRTLFHQSLDLGQLYRIDKDQPYDKVNLLKRRYYTDMFETVTCNFEEKAIFQGGSLISVLDGLKIENDYKLSVACEFSKIDNIRKNMNEIGLPDFITNRKDHVSAYLLFRLVTSTSQFKTNYSIPIEYISSESLNVQSATHFIFGVEKGIHATVEFIWKLENPYDEMERSTKSSLLEIELEELGDCFSANIQPENSKNYNDFTLNCYINGKLNNQKVPSTSNAILEFLTRIKNNHANFEQRNLRYTVAPFSVLHGLGIQQKHLTSDYFPIHDEVAKRILEILKKLELQKQFTHRFFIYCQDYHLHLDDGTLFEAQKLEEKFKNNYAGFILRLGNLLSNLRQGQSEANKLESLIIEKENELNTNELDQIFSQFQEVKDKIQKVSAMKALGIKLVGKKETLEEAIVGMPSTFFAYFCSIKALSDDENAKKNDRLADYLIKDLKVPGIFVNIDLNSDRYAPTRISYCEDRKWLTNDLVNNFPAGKCYVRCNSYEQGHILDNITALKLPCPKIFKEENFCKQETQEWYCEACDEKVYFGSDNYFYCSHCGKAPSHQFSFRCGDWEHGSKYEHFETSQLINLLQQIQLVPEMNILVVGETGVGKSTWINSFANYVMFSTLDEALETFVDPVIPAHFVLTDKNMLEHEIKLGESKNEVREIGQSSTQNPLAHVFHHKDLTIRFIDTPGIADVRGEEQDDLNFESILSYISQFDKLDAICILLKANATKLSATYRYCMGELMAHLHQSAVKNIMFCFTNSRSYMFTPAESLPLLREYLKDQGSEIELNDDNVYCVDNEAFRYLCATRCGVDWLTRNHRSYAESYTISMEETYKMLRRIKELDPYLMRDMKSINEARRIISILIRPTIQIIVNLQMNLAILKSRIFDITSNVINDDLLKIPHINISISPVEEAFTVCTNLGCAHLENIKKTRFSNIKYSTICHRPCSLKNMVFGVFPQPELENCEVFDLKGKCSKCNCDWKDHMNVTYKINQDLIFTPFDNSTNYWLRNWRKIGKEFKQEILTTLDKKIARVENEKHIIINAMATFGSFLKQKGVLSYKDPYEAYLGHLVAHEKLQVGELSHGNQLAIFQNVLNAYSKRKNEVMASQETRIDARKIQNELFKLGYAGSFLRRAFDIVSNDVDKNLIFDQNHFYSVRNPVI